MIEPREYQRWGNAKTVERFKAGDRRVLRCDPTGSGKRLVMVWQAQRADELGKSSLIVTDRRLLVQQAWEELEDFGVHHGVIMGDIEQDRAAPVQVASIQTIQKRYLETGVGLPPADLILWDEAHKVPHLQEQLFRHYPDAFVIGFTATPVGPDGTSLLGVYDSLVIGSVNSQLIKDGFLLPTKVFAPSEPDIKGIRTNKGEEFNQKQLSTRMQELTVFADVFKEWAPYSDLQTICFAPGVAYCRGLVEDFRRRGINAELIEAATPQNQRDDIRGQFADGEIRVLLSVDVLKEGYDSPIANCAIDLQPNKQLRSYWQKIGRVKRPYKGQDHAIWLDFAGNYWRFPHPDEDPAWEDVTSDVSSQDVIQNRRKEKAEKQPWACPKCGAVPPPMTAKFGKCPSCGHEIKKAVRRIRMGDGRIKQISAEEKKRKVASKDQQVWDSCRHIAHHKKKTLNFARWLFNKRTGYWPPYGLKYMPAPNSRDWGRKPADVYPWMNKPRRSGVA